MIKIICGTCDTSLGLKTAKNGTFSLPAAEEKRLVSRGVAEYVYPVPAPMEDVETGAESPEPKTEPENEVQAGVILSEDETAAESLPEAKTGHLDPEQLMTMKLSELKAMADDLGVDDKGLRTKEDYANAIAAVEVVIEEAAICDENGEPFDASGEDIVI